MSNPVSIHDLEGSWRPLAGDELTTADRLLTFAWAIVRARFPDIETRMAAVTDPLDVELVRGVIVAMVLRAMRNPDGKRREQIDDYSYERDAAVADGSLYLSDAEADLLAPPGTATGAFTIRPTFTAGYGDDTPLQYLNWS